LVALLVLAAACFAQAADRPSFPWLGNLLGLEHEVPAPWTPVTLEQETVGVWGRTIRYDNTFLPVQITSQNVPLLAAPMSLVLTTGGKPLAFQNMKTGIVSRRDDQVVLEATGSAGRLKCRTTTTIEFDGMIKIGVLLVPDGPVEIDGLRIVIPVRPEVARVFSRFLEYDFVNLRTNKMDIANCMAPVGDGRIDVEFLPEVSLLNRRVGLTWNAETNAQWDYTDPKKALSVIPGQDRTDLVMNVVDHAVTLDRSKTVEFALFPTPLKPFDPRLRQIRLGASGRFTNAFRAGISRQTYDYYAIPFPDEFDAAYDGLPMGRASDRNRYARARHTREGLKYVPYGALWYGNAVHPAGRKFYPDWHLAPVSISVFPQWKKYDAGETRDLNKSVRGSWDGYRVCAWPRSYADFLVWTYCRAIEKEKIDGIYFDHGEVVISCRNPNHKHIVEPTGKQPHLYFGVFSNRELLKRLWIATKKLKPDLIITQHQSHTSKGLNSFMDIVSTGEIHNCIFAGSHSSAGVIKNPSSYVPDYDKVPRTILDYDCLESYGFDSRLIPQVKYAVEAYWQEHPVEYKFYSDKLFRYTLVNGIRMYDGNMEQKSINEAWKALDHMGRWTPDLVFHGWWDNALTARPAHATTKVSYYARPGKVLLILANESKREVTESVTLKLPGQFARAIDAVTGEPVTLEASVLQAKVPAELYRAVLLTP
jgi:hypothetical protein